MQDLAVAEQALEFRMQAQESSRHDRSARTAPRNCRKRRVSAHQAMPEEKQAADYAKESPVTPGNKRIRAEIFEIFGGIPRGS
jgi:IS5 family transposase